MLPVKFSENGGWSHDGKKVPYRLLVMLMGQGLTMLTACSVKILHFTALPDLSLTSICDQRWKPCVKILVHKQSIPGLPFQALSILEQMLKEARWH